MPELTLVLTEEERQMVLAARHKAASATTAERDLARKQAQQEAARNLAEETMHALLRWKMKAPRLLQHIDFQPTVEQVQFGSIAHVMVSLPPALSWMATFKIRVLRLHEDQPPIYIALLANPEYRDVGITADSPQEALMLYLAQVLSTEDVASFQETFDALQAYRDHA